MGAGATIGRTLHITNKQDTQVVTSDDTKESCTGRAPGGGALRAGARVPTSKLLTSAPGEQRNARTIV